jgi:hypothetical protein
LSQGLAAVAARMEPREATVACGQAAASLTRALAMTTDPSALAALAQGLAAVLTREPTDRHLQRIRGASGAVGLGTSPSFLPLTAAVPAVALEPLPAPQPEYGIDVSKMAALPAVVLDALPEPLPAQALVDLLKHPLCVGEARRVVLDQLQRHYGRAFADQWDFVRFAEGRNLDLTTPPQRP